MIKKNGYRKPFWNKQRVNFDNLIRSLPREIQAIIFKKYLSGLHARSRARRANVMVPKRRYFGKLAYSNMRAKKLMFGKK